jgi:hypothetical protein
VYLAGTLLEALMTLMVDTTQGSRCFNAHKMSRLDDYDSDSVLPAGSERDWKLKMVLAHKFALIVECK